MKMRSMEKQIDVVVKSTVARLAQPESAEVTGEFQVSGRGFPALSSLSLSFSYLAWSSSAQSFSSGAFGEVQEGPSAGGKGMIWPVNALNQ
jgi:hypothetical protein